MRNHVRSRFLVGHVQVRPHNESTMPSQPTPPTGAPTPRPARKVIPIQPASPEANSLYMAQKKVQPRSISGVFASWRWAMLILTQLVFYGLPWIQWGERQMVLFDLGARRFYLFGLVLYPQDFIYLTGLLVISALSLFLFTTIAGRLWCGFTCPQTVYTKLFMWIEHKVEGDRSARLRLDASPWTFEKIRKRGTRHLLWLLVAGWTGFTFVGYFVPIRTLAPELLALQGSWQLFWVGFYALATYGNAGFLREQVCTHMCPYARFQGVMIDKDTLVVTYDSGRGEPRAPRTRSTDHKAQGLGDCIDCSLCVQVCPVGIDIRDGMQYDCIGCGLCIDACNTVMDKMQYPRGLVRLSTQNGVNHQWGWQKLLRKVLRPRVLVYGAVLLALCIGLVASLVVRMPLKVDVVRDRAALSRIVAGGKLENVYSLQIMNATEQPQRYRISAKGLEGLVLASDAEVDVDATASRWVPVRLQIPYGSAASGSHPIQFQIEAIGSQGGQAHIAEPSVFLGPR